VLLGGVLVACWVLWCSVWPGLAAAWRFRGRSVPPCCCEQFLLMQVPMMLVDVMLCIAMLYLCCLLSGASILIDVLLDTIIKG
jgi:hypothetical protein